MAWTTSVALHSGVVGLLVAEAVILALFPPLPVASTKVVTIASGWAKLKPAEVPLEVRLPKTEDSALVATNDQTSAPREKPEVKPEDADPLPAERVNELVQKSVDEASERTDDENIEKLEQLTGTLNQVSSTDSIDALTKSLNKAFGTGERATEPAKEAVAGEFDFDTAQIHDVRRDAKEDGSFTYTAILLDAEGRTLDSELDEDSGKRIYDVMVLIKRNPLLERLYRQTLMSLFDQMMKPGGEAKKPTEVKAAVEEPAAETPPPATTPNDPQPGVPFDPFAE